MCLKYFGIKSLVNSVGFPTTNVDQLLFNKITSSMLGSSTRWNVLAKNCIESDLCPTLAADFLPYFCLVVGDIPVHLHRFCAKCRTYKRSQAEKMILKIFIGKETCASDKSTYTSRSPKACQRVLNCEKLSASKVFESCVQLGFFFNGQNLIFTHMDMVAKA